MTIETDENLEDVVRGAVITECESAGIDIYHRGDRYSSITVAQSGPTTYEASINVSGRILFDDLFAEQGSLLGINDGVSIPSWVFSLPRHIGRERRNDRTVAFQSRPGFSPCLDARSNFWRCSGSCCFNPVLGFLPASTWLSTDTRLSAAPVSIPSWVFSLPRRDRLMIATSPSDCFNPVLGFLPASTR